jgi:uncharacterized membrane protein
MRASDTDRDRVAELLTAAYVEGRLSKDEYDARLDSALSARSYADLDRLVADLPAAPAAEPQPGAAGTDLSPLGPTNGLAVASLVSALAEVILGPVAAVPAIVLGHVARHQIKRTGEQGAGLALTGLIIGWVTVVAAVVIIVGLTVAAGLHGGAPIH